MYQYFVERENNERLQSMNDIYLDEADVTRPGALGSPRARRLKRKLRAKRIIEHAERRETFDSSAQLNQCF
jgi:hypothetical protein